MKSITVVSLLLVAFLLFGGACAARAPSVAQPGSPPSTSAISSSKSPVAGNDAVVTDENRMVVHTADISLVVTDVNQTRDRIVSLANKYQGYVVSSNFRARGEDFAGVITIRVSDDKLDSAMGEIRAMGLRVTAERSSSQDVTAQYVDLQARLTNARATEAQYLTLMNRAQQISDIIQIQDKLSQVRQTIEQLQGQIEYLRNTSSTSLITVTLEPETSNQPVVQGGWSFTETLRSAARGFIEFGKLFVTILIWVAMFIPLWGIIAGIVIWRRRSQKKLPTPAKDSPAK